MEVLGSMRCVLLTLILVAGSHWGACSKQGMWAPCSSDRDCETGLCAEVFDGNLEATLCSMMCVATPCPSGYSCGTNRSGLRVCMPTCADDGYRIACVDGATTACEWIQSDRYCSACGCDDASDVCRMMDSDPEGLSPPFCGPPAQPDEQCQDDGECASGNCLVCWNDGGDLVCPGAPYYCSVFVGDACETGNCKLCLQSSDTTICTEECWQDSSCPSGSRCAKRNQDSNYYCWKVCTPGSGDCRPELTCASVGDGWSIHYYACM